MLGICCNEILLSSNFLIWYSSEFKCIFPQSYANESRTIHFYYKMLRYIQYDCTAYVTGINLRQLAIQYIIPSTWRNLKVVHIYLSLNLRNEIIFISLPFPSSWKQAWLSSFPWQYRTQNDTSIFSVFTILILTLVCSAVMTESIGLS